MPDANNERVASPRAASASTDRVAVGGGSDLDRTCFDATISGQWQMMIAEGEPYRASEGALPASTSKSMRRKMAGECRDLAVDEG